MRPSLYDFCTGHEQTHLLAQWDGERNAPLTPKDVTYGSHQKVWWYCASASNRVCSPATESKVKKLNSSEIQQNQGFLATWGYSSAGRALEWHSRGQRFDPAYLHQKQ